jgi:hypothetical protein
MANGPRGPPGILSVGESFSQQRVGGVPGGKLPLSYYRTVLTSPRTYQFLVAAVFRPMLDRLTYRVSQIDTVPVTVTDT